MQTKRGCAFSSEGVVALGRSTAQPQDWTFQRFVSARDCLVLDAVDARTVFIYGRQNDGSAAIFRTTDGGETWAVFPWDGLAVYDLSAVDSNLVWAVSFQRIYHSTNGGRSWQVQYDAADSAVHMFDYIEMFDSLRGVAVGDPPEGRPIPILHTEDGGRRWHNVNDTSFVGAHLSDVWRSVDFVSPQVGYLRYAYFGVPLVNFFLHRTVDGGASWSATPLSADRFNILRFYDETFGLAAWRGDTPVYRTTDGGRTWTAHPLDLGDEWGEWWVLDIEFVPGEPSQVLALIGNSVLFSADSGKTWTVVGAPNDRPLRDLEMAGPDTGWIAGDGGIVRIERSASGVFGRTGSRVPDSLALVSVEPNPFRGSTTIAFRGTAGSEIRVDVFDVRGRRVVTLVERVLERSGRHTVQWSGTDEQGQLLPPGVYLVRLSAGGVVSTAKVTLMR